MSTAPYLALEILLVESTGPFYRAGLPQMIARLQATHVPGSAIEDGNVVVLVRDQATSSWKEHKQKISLPQAQDMVKRLEALRMPGRTPDVRGIPDTADSWSHLFLRVNLGDHLSYLDISMSCSGFIGPDSDALKALFREVFELAGYSGYSSIIYGKPGSAGTGRKS